MSNKKHYHPISIIIYTISGLKILLPILIFFLFRKGTTNISRAVLLLTITCVLVLSYSIIRYCFELYEITDQKIVVYKGIFRKKESDIPYERIQSIHQRQWIFLKPFKLSSIVIKTAADVGEVNIPAVPTRILHQIEGYKKNRQQIEQIPSKKSQFTYVISNFQIFLFGLTDVTVFAGIFTVLMFLQEHIPERWLDQLENYTLNIIKVGWILGLSLAILFVLIALVASLAKNFFQYYKFTVARKHDTLVIERGFFARDIQNIPISKIQAVQIKQQAIRKLLHISTVELILAGGGKDDDGADSSNQIRVLPIISDRKLFEVLKYLLPEGNICEPQLQFSSRGRILYFWRWYLLAYLIVAFISYFLRLHWLVIAIASILLMFLLLMDWLDCHYQGYALQANNRICVQNFRIFTKVQTFVDRSKIQSFKESTSYWLYQKELGHFKLNLKAGSDNKALGLRYIQKQDVRRVAKFYRAI
jgi:putative membrane protein